MTYNPPKTPSRTLVNELSDIMERAHINYSNIWIIGDLNCDLLVNAKSEPIRELCDMHDMTQTITSATNHTCHGDSLIDIILTTKPDMCEKSGSENVGLSDSHDLIFTVLKTVAPRRRAKTVTYRQYKHFDMDCYLKDISQIPATACQLFEDVSDNYWVLQSLLLDVIEDHAPMKTAKVRSKEVPFMNRRLKRAVRDKTRLYNRYRKYPNSRNWELPHTEKPCHNSEENSYS